MPTDSYKIEFSVPPGEEFIQSYVNMGVEPAIGAPPRSEGSGPYNRLILRGPKLIDGTGAPLHGPVDIVIANDRIEEVRSSPYVGQLTPSEEDGDFELDCSNMYVLPGFVDSHVHIGSPMQGSTGPLIPAEYVFKLWLAHGITTVRECGAFMGLKWTLEQEKKSTANEITAPRIVTYPVFFWPLLNSKIKKKEDVEAWVSEVVKSGVNGIKYFGGPPDISETLFAECRDRGLRTACHHSLLYSARVNALDSARMGLTSMEHGLGLPVVLCTRSGIQDFPLDFNDSDEQAHFLEGNRMWGRTKPGGTLWNEVIEEMLELNFTLVPTLAVYEAGRDVMRTMWAEWHKHYTLPAQWRFFQPSRVSHGSFYFDWTTANEIEWRENYRYWSEFLNDYKNRGGRITTGSDAGFIFKLFGFDFIRELEMFQEAGFHPLEVIQSASIKGAELLNLDKEIGTIEAGKKADLILVTENPIANFKVLYGTGHMRLSDETGQIERVGGVRWTIKDGIIYDAKELLADVREMVAKEKESEAASVGKSLCPD